MAKRGASPDRLTIKGLSEADQQWLASEAERLGSDIPNLVRMMIRARRSLLIVEEPPPTLAPGPPQSALHASYYDDAPFADNGEPLPVEDVDVPRDPESGPELDELLRNAPSILDQATEPRPQRQAAYNGHRRPPVQPRHPRYRQEPARAPAPVYAGGAMGAFSLTQFVGISDRAQLGSIQGDAHGNVAREAYKHFGFAPGRRG